MQAKVKTVQTRLSLKETRFENDRLARLGIEVMSFSYLFSRTTKRALCVPERVHFYMLMLVTGGCGEHTVDGVHWRLSRGSLLLIRPGQIQQWHVRSRYAAEIVLFDPAALNPATTTLPELASFACARGCIRVPRASISRLQSDLADLKLEIRRYDNAELGAALVRHMLLVLLLRVMRWSRAARPRDHGQPGPRTHRLFLQLLETDFRRQHRAYHYARRLGYSLSTLNRVCAIAEARSAKAVIDARIGLEAQRLLLHSAASSAEISHHLGFSETTNFVRFFTRVVGQSPATLRG